MLNSLYTAYSAWHLYCSLPHEWFLKFYHSAFFTKKDIHRYIFVLFQSEVIERQCSEAIAVAERKLEAAEERQTMDQNRAETAADPEVVKEAVDAGE